MLDFSSLSRAINALDESLDVVSRYLGNHGSTEAPEYRTFRAGVIQNFEIAYELSWKAMRTWLGENLGKTAIDGITRKELFRFAAESYLIDDVKAWFNYHKFRNQTSHTYEESIAKEVFEQTPAFAKSTRQLLNTLTSKND